MSCFTSGCARNAAWPERELRCMSALHSAGDQRDQHTASDHMSTSLWPAKSGTVSGGRSFLNNQLIIKGAVCSLGEDVSVRREMFSLLFCLLNKQSDLTGHHNFLLFYFICLYTWRTLPPFQRQVGYSSETSLIIQVQFSIFIQGKGKFFWTCMITSLILWILKFRDLIMSLKPRRHVYKTEAASFTVRPLLSNLSQSSLFVSPLHLSWWKTIVCIHFLPPLFPFPLLGPPEGAQLAAL